MHWDTYTPHNRDLNNREACFQHGTVSQWAFQNRYSHSKCQGPRNCLIGVPSLSLVHICMVKNVSPLPHSSRNVKKGIGQGYTLYIEEQVPKIAHTILFTNHIKEFNHMITLHREAGKCSPYFSNELPNFSLGRNRPDTGRKL